MIVILTALQAEYKAVRKHVTGLRQHRHRAGTVFEAGVLADHPDKHVAMAVLGAGNSGAAALTERAIAEFQPSVVMFVGIAGALRDWLRLGDIVVATKIYGYHGGTSEDRGFSASPQAWHLSHSLDQAARHLDVSNSWRSALPVTTGHPNVHFQPIVAGEVVLKSTSSAVAEQVQDHYSDAIAIEMESAGVAHASHLNLSQPTITIRGISDFASASKDFTDRTGAPSLAADNAAAFAVSLIAQLDDADAAFQTSHQVSPPPVVHNVSGPAEFVALMGIVRGPLHIDDPDRTFDSSSAMPRLLLELTEAVVADHEAGRLDERTFNLGMEALYDARTQTHQSRRGEAIRKLNELFGQHPRLRAILAEINRTL
ncbi:nucleoside phosphorylase [Kibdelosporangium banguiense]|uniref:Nucleoside phosphorylase n=1 Tax=Kibdelosporangium banguiense TaxID=1365924 RepID=A0ABS4TS43_9PSEU|nr:5'-methylthioadenosine/S-adenosylhomocysteine nucleosidase [Kibdelosporangium banguiense]MBP2327222.1 nucleoside phosphorylase [Kibdelosporangium banguiense]